MQENLPPFVVCC